VSSDVYRDYVTQGPGIPRPRDFRAVTTVVKGESFTAHLLVPGADMYTIAALADFDVPVVEAAAPQPRTGAASGSSPAGASRENPGPVPEHPLSVGRDYI